MKKNYIYSILVTCVLCFSFTQAQSAFKLDSIHQYSWENSLNDWKFNTRDLYTYDNGGDKETNLLRLILSGSNWENFYQYNKAYDTNNNLIESLLQNWDGGNWINGSRDTYTYDASNNKATFSYAIYSTGNWLVFNENTYTYNGLNNITEDTSTAYDFTTMNMVNDKRLTYLYNANDLLETEITEEWRSFLNDWENTEKIDYTYNVNDEVTLVEISAWNLSLLAWSSPYRQTLFTYNGNGMPIEVTEQVMATGSWLNTSKVINTYDANGNLTEMLGQEWDSSSSTWINAFRQLRTFDANDNEIELIYENWDTSTSLWKGFIKQVKFWSPTETLSFAKPEALYTIKVYPNPVSNELHIKFNTPVERATNIVLFDVLGNEVFSNTLQKGTSVFRTSIENQNSGIYFLRVGNTETFKLLKQ